MNPSVVTIDDNNSSAVYEKGEHDDQEPADGQPALDRKSRGVRQHYLSVPPAEADGSPDLKQPEKQKIRENAYNMIDSQVIRSREERKNYH